MKVTVKVDINTAKIMNSRGLGGDNRAQKHLASEVARFCDPYVPMQQGNLKNQHTIAPDGSRLVYTQPYAHYQYYEKVYGPNVPISKDGGTSFISPVAPKHPTGKRLTYHGAPMRGGFWDKRMMADKSGELTKSLEAYIKKG